MHSLMDPPTLTVLSEAVAQAAGKQHVAEIEEDVLAVALKISDAFSSEGPTNNPEALRLARNFCMGLSMAAVAYLKSIRDLCKTRPFRKAI